MSKKISLQFDNDVIEKAESILDDIGMDCQTFVNMCFKKLNKEQNISFLTSGNAPAPKQETIEKTPLPEQPLASEAEDYSLKTKNTITSEMRDSIWDIFISQFKANKKIDCTYLAKLANLKTGITQGSAYIYFLILDNLVEGIPNTRTMKFNDLVVYLKNIYEQLPKNCIQNAVKSLSESTAYWKDHIQGYFAQKVSALVAQYNNFKGE